MKYYFYLLSLILISNFSFTQKSDTVYISPKNIKVENLKEGKSVYLVYYREHREATRTMTQFWTREVKVKTENGKKIIEVYQSWEDKDSIIHTAKSLCDAQTFKPLFHESWWNVRGKTSTSVYNYETKQVTIDGNDAVNDTSVKGKQLIAGFLKVADMYHLNWHLDLEAFSTLPLSLHKTYGIPFYETGYKEPENNFYTVSGEDQLKGYDNQPIACWVLTHKKPGNKEKFWISKKTKDVLKLEQEVNGKMYRYKIKLGFSD
ncbi:hypothetical protein [Epilithonimonas sp.]|uniref:DUF3108 domain-containing protein n=1 Tax=Epilithonimonas sp. TaxID=2894511 RepID=UPI0028AEF42A|nr:hypothetical protein [Epilithonimonas sp.]